MVTGGVPDCCYSQHGHWWWLDKTKYVKKGMTVKSAVVTVFCFQMALPFKGVEDQQDEETFVDPPTISKGQS